MKYLVKLAALSVACAFPNLSLAQAQGGQPDWLSQAKIVAQMEGISVGEAVRRARLEQKLAVASERLEQDENYAGSFIEHSGNSYKIIHSFKAGNKPAGGTGDADLEAASEYRSARFSMKEIKTYQNQVIPLLKTSLPNAYTEIDVRNNKLFVYANDIALATSTLATNGPTPAFVEIRQGSWFAGQQALVSGAGAINGTAGSCTASFSVKNATLSGIATANHCIPNNLTTHRSVSIGTNRGGAYTKGVTDMPGRDGTWYRNDANTYDNRVLYAASFYSITSVGAQSPAVGTPVCLIRQNGTQECAYVGAVATPPGGTYPAVIMDREVGVPGDSGGSWLYGSIAYGVHTGKKCDDPALTINCKALYTSVATLSSTLGVSVIIK